MSLPDGGNPILVLFLMLLLVAGCTIMPASSVMTGGSSAAPVVSPAP